MAYIGKTPTIGNFQKCDAITVVNGQAAYTMQVGGTNVSPESENHMLVSLNGILQAPTDSFTVSGSTITFASNLSTGDVIDFIMILGNVLDLGVPSDNTVTNAKIVDSTIALGKLSATGTKDATTFLRGDNTFVGAGITEADNWRLTANFTGNVDPITSNLERVDTTGQGTLGTGMTVSSGRFTFPSTGIWLVRFNHMIQFKDGNALFRAGRVKVTTNNSTYTSVSTTAHSGLDEGYALQSAETLIDVTDTSNVKVSFATESMSTNDVTVGNTAQNETSFTFIRLGDT